MASRAADQPVLSARPPASRAVHMSEQTTSAPSTKPHESRPTSLWPTSTRPGELSAHTAFDVSEFEDPNVARARQVERVTELFDLCQPTLVFRVVLFVQVGVAVA